MTHHHDIHPRTPNKQTLLAMVACHVAGLFFLPLMPLLLGAIANDFNANSIQLGTMGTIQLSCTAVGAILLSKLVSVYNCRTLVLLALLVELMVNLASAIADSMTTIMLLRAISGLCQGMLLAAAAAIAARSQNTVRIYALYNSMLAVFAVMGLLLGAELIQQYGHAGGFFLFAAIDSFAFLLMLNGFPSFFIRIKANKMRVLTSNNTKINFRPMFALVLFGAALSGTQTFVERIGGWHGGSIASIGQSLAAGWSLAIVTPFFVLPFIRKWGSINPLVTAYIFVALVALALSLTTSLSYYLIAAALFTPAAVFIEPLQFGILATVDSSGRLAALGPAAISVGSGLGPVVAGSFVGVFGLKSIGILGCLLFLISLFVLFPLVVKTYKDDC